MKNNKEHLEDTSISTRNRPGDITLIDELLMHQKYSVIFSFLFLFVEIFIRMEKHGFNFNVGKENDLSKYFYIYSGRCRTKISIIYQLYNLFSY